MVRGERARLGERVKRGVLWYARVGGLSNKR